MRVSRVSMGSPVFERYAEAKTLRELLACIRDFGTETPFHDVGKPSLRLALTSNYSTQFIAKGFPLALAARGLDASVYESPYGHWQIDLLDLASPLYRFAPTHILAALTSIELAFASLRTPHAVADALVTAIGRALAETSAQVFLTLPEPLAEEVSDWSGAYAWRYELNTRLRKLLDNPRVTLIDIEPLIRQSGAVAWFDDRYYDSSKLPCHPDRIPSVLALFADAISGHIIQRCKLVIVDLDDTLWGGRVGDDGWEGIDVDPAGTGRHFLRMQLFLKRLAEQGVILAVASKNHPDSVNEAFLRRPEMILKLEDFVTMEVHWEPKSLSVARILKRLNLSTAGIVFLDDNPAEREEVRRKFPDIFIPELPDNPAERVSMLMGSGMFDRRVITPESRERAKMYRENSHRESELAAIGDLDAFLRNLDMEMEIMEVGAARERTLELIQKTNQFNLTTRRYNWDELCAAIRPGFGLCYRLKDRFGDNGVISVILVALEPQDGARIDLWLMSCRVLGRHVEEAILSDVAARAKALGARKLLAEYLPTTKNKLVQDLYPRLGFEMVEKQLERDLYERDLSVPVEGNNLIRIVERIAGAS